MNPETARLTEVDREGWKKWGPYIAERQWGAICEDYSTHDQARFRAYHWGEEGIAGICDQSRILCFALALWNGADPIHGEDVKEDYFFLDSAPAHSYMKFFYKYPQAAYPPATGPRC